VTFQPGSKLSVIADSAFYSCWHLSAICLPPSVTILGRRAFEETALKSISIPASVQRICQGCFTTCRKLAAVDFDPESRLSVLEAYAFESSSLLTSISIPSAVERIGDRCFFLCYELSKVTFQPDSKLVGLGKAVFDTIARGTEIRAPRSIHDLLGQYPSRVEDL
jgi:hypothetical protein